MTTSSRTKSMAIGAVSLGAIALAYDTNVTHSLLSTDLPGYGEMANWFLFLGKSVVCIGAAAAVGKVLERALLKPSNEVNCYIEKDKISFQLSEKKGEDPVSATYAFSGNGHLINDFDELVEAFKYGMLKLACIGKVKDKPSFILNTQVGLSNLEVKALSQVAHSSGAGAVQIFTRNQLIYTSDS